MLNPGHWGTTDCQMACAGQRGRGAPVFKVTSIQFSANQAAFFLTHFSSFLSFLIFFSIFLI